MHQKKYVGDFNCAANRLETLFGAPKIVWGDFDCNNNKLTSLEYAPKKVSRGFYCYDNKRKFTEDYVLKVSNVIKERIHVEPVGEWD